MKKTFKAAVLVKQNKPLQILDLYHQEPNEGEVKIRMITTGLCGAQVNEMSGKKGEDKYLPHLMGHEGYGEVIQIGSNVSKVEPGDHVVIHWREAKGLAMPAVKYLSKDGMSIGAGPCTTFSEFTIVAENRCTKIMKNDNLEKALPLLGCAISTSYGAIEKEAQVSKDDDILIFGAGGLGMALMFWCKVLGYKNVDVVDIHPDKEEQVREFGGHFYLSSNIDQLKTYDKVFETTGVIQNIENTLMLSKNSAKVVLIGQPKIGSNVTFKNFLKIYDNIKYIPSMGGQFDPDIDMNKIFKLVEENSELANNLVSKVIKLDEINNGFEEMKSPTARRVIIKF